MVTPLLAEQKDAADLVQSPEFLWLVAALVGVMLLGAILFSLVERWRKRQLSDSPESDVVQITSYRTMFERGELTVEEYDRIKAKEAKRLREKLVAKPAGPAKIAQAGQAPPAQSLPQEPQPPSPPAE
jgi:hypothetical protein